MNAGEFRRLRAASDFAHGGKVTKTPPGTRPMDYGSAGAPPRSIGPLSPDPRYGGYPLKWAEHFRRAKQECLGAVSSGPTGGLSGRKIGTDAVPLLRLGLPNQRSRPGSRRRGGLWPPKSLPL